MKGLLIALQFLTRIPVRIRGDLSDRDIGRSALFFPLVGVLQGAFAAFSAFVFALVFSPRVAGGLFVVALLATNWGFHVDGLADSADAVSVKSTGDAARDREKRLAVMKESTVGAMGVTAILSVLLLKYLFVSELLERGLTWDVLLVLFLIPVFSKWAMVPVIFHGRSATDTGLGSIFVRYANPAVLLGSTLLLAAVFFLATRPLPGITWRSMAALFFLFSTSAYVAGLLWAGFCRNKFGGLTGDTIGAVSEMAEVLLPALGLLWI